ncbi:MAG: tetratricopeptide repeat protein [Gammaproteobacteria bacterium]
MFKESNQKNINARFKKAKATFSQGHYDKTLLQCDTILENSPSHAPTINLKGLAAHRLKQTDLACELLKKACDLEKDNIIFKNNLGSIFKEQGKHQEAIILFKNIIATKPEFAEAYINLAACYFEQQQFNEGTHYLKAASNIKPSDINIRQQYANALMKINKIEDAIAQYQKIIALIPDFATVFVSLGAALQSKKAYKEAEKYYRQALTLNPQHTDALCNLGVLAKIRGEFTEAITLYQQALTINPQLYTVYANLGNALQEIDAYDEAIQCYNKALAINPAFVEAYNSRGYAYQSINQIDRAMADYHSAMTKKENYIDAHWNYALALLITEQYEEGWKEYEYRWQKLATLTTSDTKKRWQGESLRDKTLLIQVEQGYGDTIQFIRYVPLIKKNGGRIILVCREPLVQLLQQIKGIDDIIVKGHVLPAYDYHLPLLSLPLIFNTTAVTIPAAIPYIKADSHKVKQYAAFMDVPKQVKRIGIAWEGSPTHKNNRRRSLPIHLFEPLFTIKNTQFYSLQKGDAATILEQRTDLPIVNLGNLITDFNDSAAFIAQLDLIIAVDTALVHLAGAMGKPVWTLVTFAPDFRWLLEREDSPWYPTMRLFRQPQLGDWDSAFKQVKLALSSFTG